MNKKQTKAQRIAILERLLGSGVRLHLAPLKAFINAVVTTKYADPF